MSNYNTRVMTLHPDEHVDILTDRVHEAWQLIEQENREAAINVLEDVANELMALRNYLRTQRLQ